MTIIRKRGLFNFQWYKMLCDCPKCKSNEKNRCIIVYFPLGFKDEVFMRNALTDKAKRMKWVSNPMGKHYAPDHSPLDLEPNGTEELEGNVWNERS